MKDIFIYLVRPGKLELKDDQRRFIGQVNVPLNAEGVIQARNLCNILTNVNFSAAYCSDLVRSRQTAEIIVAPKGCGVVTVPKLREIHLGKWEGKSMAEVARKYPKAFQERGADLFYYRVAGGESYVDCSKRVVAAFQEIMENSQGNILVAGHIDVNRLLLCHILGLPMKNMFRISQKHGCLNIIAFTNSQVRVEVLNYTTLASL
jgi:alpha-ribazole phosphatase